ncbi:hypothetical protein [Cryobacterium sp. Y62]
MGAVFGGDHGLFDQAVLVGRKAVLLITTGGSPDSFGQDRQFGASPRTYSTYILECPASSATTFWNRSSRTDQHTWTSAIARPHSQRFMTRSNTSRHEPPYRSIRPSEI